MGQSRKEASGSGVRVWIPDFHDEPLEFPTEEDFARWALEHPRLGEWLAGHESISETIKARLGRVARPGPPEPDGQALEHRLRSIERRLEGLERQNTRMYHVMQTTRVERYASTGTAPPDAPDPCQGGRLLLFDDVGCKCTAATMPVPIEGYVPDLGSFQAKSCRACAAVSILYEMPFPRTTNANSGRIEKIVKPIGDAYVQRDDLGLAWTPHAAETIG